MKTILSQLKKKNLQGRQVVSHSNGLSNGLQEERAEMGKKKETLVLASFQKKEAETKKERREVVPDLDSERWVDPAKSHGCSQTPYQEGRNSGKEKHSISLKGILFRPSL